MPTKSDRCIVVERGKYVGQIQVTEVVNSVPRYVAGGLTTVADVLDVVATAMGSGSRVDVVCDGKTEEQFHPRFVGSLAKSVREMFAETLYTVSPSDVPEGVCVYAMARDLRKRVPVCMATIKLPVKRKTAKAMEAAKPDWPLPKELQEHQDDVMRRARGAAAVLCPYSPAAVVLDLSTAHMDGPNPRFSHHPRYKTEVGYILPVMGGCGHAELFDATDGAVPCWLKEVYQYALQVGALFINFDKDGEKYNFLPIYNW